MNQHHQGIGMTSMRTRERLIKRLIDSGISDTRVLDTIRQIPRHIFIDEALASRAYEDTALPIGFGQTISQPHSVAKMTEIVLSTAPKKCWRSGQAAATRLRCWHTWSMRCIASNVSLHCRKRRVCT